MALSLDELFSDKANTAVVAMALAAIAATAAEESPEAVPAPEVQKENETNEPTEAANEGPAGTIEEAKEKATAIELRVPICCEGCVKKIEKKLRLMEGVEAVECDVDLQKVTVRGTVNPEAVLERARKVQKRSEIWEE